MSNNINEHKVNISNVKTMSLCESQVKGNANEELE